MGSKTGTPPDATLTTERGGGARIAIACGGTAGDVHPALAVAEALPPGVEAILVGGTAGLERRLAALRGHRLRTTPTAPLARASVPGKVRALVATAVGTLGARRILRREGVGLVLGFGGYATAPAVLAARSLGIPVLLFEGNAVAGRANRALGRCAARALLGCPSAARAFPCPTTVTGVPVRAEILAVRASRPEGPLRVLVCGGSLGSRFLDERVPPLLSRVAASGVSLTVRHVGDPTRAQAAYARAGLEATAVAFVDDMAAEYARAHVAIVSAGATTLAELAAVGLPAVLVPLAAAAHDHQTPNARDFAAATGARWWREPDWDEEPIAAHLASLGTSAAAWTAAAAGMRGRAQPGATDAVVAACLAMLSRTRRAVPARASGSPRT